VFCQWLLAKCVVNTQSVGNIQFSDEERFAMDGAVNFHNTHVWVDDNPHTTVALRHQHRCLCGHLRWSTLRTGCLNQTD
jgi:hypothetical protein